MTAAGKTASEQDQRNSAVAELIGSATMELHKIGRMFLYLLGCLALSRLLAAEALELPAELSLAAPAVTIELWNADVEVLSDPTARPVLRAAAAGDDPAPGSLEQIAVNGVFTIRRPAAETFRLKVDIVVGAEQELLLAGRDLSVVAREAPQAGVTAPLGLRLDLESSELDLEGGRDGVLRARESSVFLSRTRGLLTVTLESGTAEIRGHEGELKLEAAGAEVTLIDFQGQVEPRLRGGSLDVREGSGRLAGTATGAVVLLAGWRGPLALTGAGTTVEARSSGDERQPWKLEGNDLLITLEQLAGPVNVQLDGGRLAASAMTGVITVVGTKGADVELTDLALGTDLKLSGAAAARLSDVSGNLKAEVNDARLEADGIGRLTLTGARSEVRASLVGSVAGLEMSDSELDLDLSTIVRSSPWRLLGTSRAQVRLPTPCMVQIDGPRDLVSDQINVSGCELRIPGQPVRSTRGRLIYGDRGLLMLTVTLGAGAELEVEGRSR